MMICVVSTLKLRFLRSASIKELIDRPDLKLEVQGGSKSLDQIAASVLGSKFAHDLLKSGVSLIATLHCIRRYFIKIVSVRQR